MTGSELLEEIASFWKVEEANTFWGEGGFDWIPDGYLVQVRAFPPRESAPVKDPRWCLTVETELLTAASITDAMFSDRLAAMAPSVTPSYSLVYAPENMKPHLKDRAGDLSFFNSVYVNSEMVPITRLFARLALLQPINAKLLGDYVAKDFGMEPAFVESGRTHEGDAVLAAAFSIYRDEGAKPSRWSNVREFAAFARDYAHPDNCVGSGDASSLTLETPFGDNSALIRLRSDQPHPYLGNGLLVTVDLPVVQSLQDVSAEAMRLNFLEARTWTDFPQLGCWHVFQVEDEEVGLIHSSFVPNAVYGELVASNLAMWSLQRAQWARRTRWPDLEDKPMSEIFQERLRTGVYR